MLPLDLHQSRHEEYMKARDIVLIGAFLAGGAARAQTIEAPVETPAPRLETEGKRFGPLAAGFKRYTPCMAATKAPIPTTACSRASAPTPGW